jgi:ketosteroid isomerase-like protein
MDARRAAIVAACLMAWTGLLPHPVHAAAEACGAAAYRGLDFWLGTWSVHSDDPDATSVIERLAAGCALLENYHEPGGYSGKSLNYVDPHDHAWHQVWIDSTGALSQFVGAPRPGGGIDFTGETRRPRGDSARRRMSLAPEGTGTVRQLSRVSFDGGATWKPHYSLEYRPDPGPPVAGPCQTPGDPVAEAAARAIAGMLAAADNARALERVLALYQPEAVLLPPGERPSAEVRARYRALFSDSVPAIESHVDQVCVAGPVALVEGHNEGWLRPKRGGRARRLDDDYWMLLRNDAAGWRISVLAWRPRSAPSPARG